jgi:hypothetical protein
LGNISDLIDAGLVPTEDIQVALHVPSTEVEAVAERLYELMDLDNRNGDAGDKILDDVLDTIVHDWWFHGHSLSIRQGARS